MQNSIENHNRMSIRIKGFDYSTPGAYFVTVVTQGRKCLFGEVLGGELICNPAGDIINKTWLSLAERFPEINVDIYQIMPNHFQGIIIINDVGATLVVTQNVEAIRDRAGTRPAPTVGEIVVAFKSISTHAYIQGVHMQGWPPFSKTLWQRNYYEHIIRDQNDLENIANYIQSNPGNWENDDKNQTNPSGRV